jgi:Zn-dependent peptidase ImmA (M78 family)
MACVEVQAKVFRWALERSGHTEESARSKFLKFSEWLDGTRLPTLRQLEKFANWTRTPFGFFLLDSPPEDRLPIPDFRTTHGQTRRPSPDLLETVQSMQRRQEWMREFLLEEGQEPLEFVGKASTHDSPKDVAQSMRVALDLSEDWARRERSWGDALRLLRQAIEAAEIMVVINGVVGNNNHRLLDVNEFRGFALVDPIAPLIFVNGKDAKCAKMFTLAHELAHIWIGQEGVSNLDRLQPVGAAVEKFCNKVAAEFLVPAHRFQSEWQKVSTHPDRFNRLARTFKVSAIVVARRAWDMRHINRQEFFEFYDRQIQESPPSPGGNFWKTQGVRIGDLFGSAVAQAVWAGQLLYRDAYELTGLRGKTFDNYIARLGL